MTNRARPCWRWFAFGLLLMLSLGAHATTLDARLVRYPDLSAREIVFSYADDLWIVARDGGVAQRLSASGGEKAAKFSPDGEWLAYSALRDGQGRVFTLPRAGGVPRAVLNHPAGARVLGWTPDGSHVLVASRMTSERPNFNQLHLLPRAGGLPQRLPMPFGENASYSADGRTLVYTIHQDFQEESWKRYRGGRAPKLWSYDLRSGASHRLTGGDAPDSQPIFVGAALYFLSERGPEQRSNLWTIEIASGALRQVTHFTDDDVRHPSGGASGLVFCVGGRLYRMDAGSETLNTVPITIADEQTALAPSVRPLADQLGPTDLSASGELLAIEARGEVFTLERTASGSSLVVNQTRTAGAAERFPSLSPDATQLAYWSDANGEYQLHVKTLASRQVRVLTRFTDGMRFKPQWSPDAKWLVFLDQRGDLHLIDAATGAQHRVLMRTEQLRHGEPFDDAVAFRAAWSHDSRWVAFASAVENRNHALFVYDLKSAKLSRLSSGYYNDFAPVFDPRGEYLYCVSLRRYEPVYGDLDGDTWLYANSATISAIALRKGVPSVLAARDWSARKTAPVEIDVDGFESRLVTLALDDGNIEELAATADRLVYLSLPRTGAGGATEGSIRSYTLATQAPATLLARADTMQLSADGTQLLARQGKALHRLVLGGARESGKEEAVSLAGLSMRADPAPEAAQMLREAWRYHRDFFYDPGLHHRDWPQVWTRYAALLPAVKTENDLGFLLRELSGELGAGHVHGLTSPRRAPQNVAKVGLLGVDFELRDGAYRIRRIVDPGLRAAELRSPLALVDVREGDELIEVNGQPLDTTQDPWTAFVGLAEQEVQLGIARGGNRQALRQVRVRTLADEQKLRELSWVEANRRAVLAASGGKVGYLYLPDTSANGVNDLMRQFRAQYKLPALLIDERFNRGGSLGDRLVELLNRPTLAWFKVRNGTDYPLPTIGHGGPKALLTNGWSYSGGDGFPLLFQNAKLGPLIGSRTWGGLVGPGLYLPLIGGGVVSPPPQRVYNPDGTWSGGNVGVAPDIPVETDPGALMQGREPHLERGVAHLLQQLAKLPARPAAPTVESTGL